MRQRHLGIIFTALILSLLAYFSSVLFLKPPAVHASAYVIGSDPVDGSTIASVPQEIHIYFNAPISILGSAHVFVVQQGTQNSSLVEVGANTGVISGSNPNELIIPLRQAQGSGPAPDRDKPYPPLQQGSYLIRWTAVANDDGRTTFGSIGFNVGFSSTGLSGTPILGPSTSNDLDEIRALDVGHATQFLSVVWEFVMIAALTLWIGTLVMEHFVLSDGDRCTELHVHTKKRALSFQWLCLCALLFSEIVSLVLRTTSIVEKAHANSSYLSTLQSLLLNTNYGHLWLAGLILTLMAMGLYYRTNRSGTKSSPQTDTLHPATPPGEEESGKSTMQTIRPASAPARSRTGANPVPTEMSPLPGVRMEKRQGIGWLLLSGLILLTLVLSRAPAQTFQPHMSSILFDWLNLAALGIWLGSFVYLGYLILPLFSSKKLHHHTETLATVLHRLTPFILVAIGIEFVSTLFLSEAAISQPQQLLGDPYGRTLLIQMVLFVTMLALSLYALLDWDKPQSLHARLKRQILLLPLVHADLPTPRLRQSELQQTKKSLGLISIFITWLAVGVLLCIALMTFFTPPIHFPAITYSDQLTGPASTTNAQTQQIGDLSVSLQLLPGQSEKANTVILLINDNTGKAVTNAQVRLTTNMQAMDMGTRSALIPGATSNDPVYTTTFDKGATFNMVGIWIITVEIQQPDQNPVQGTFQVMIS
jgi:methionine-rich copper-binding protein CopC/putative copper export protein